MVARRLEDIRMLVDWPIVFNQVNALGIRISLANLLIEKDQFVATDFAPLTKQDASRDGHFPSGQRLPALHRVPPRLLAPGL